MQQYKIEEVRILGSKRKVLEFSETLNLQDTLLMKPSELVSILAQKGISLYDVNEDTFKLHREEDGTLLLDYGHLDSYIRLLPVGN